MAKNTPKSYRNQIMYSIFVRNHTAEGTFEAVRRDLERIRALGVDIIWLMPIHPIGTQERKGGSGSPYAISDYRAVNPDYGTLEDFRRLVEETHRLGMKCIIDVVYNHTSPDSWLVKHHPEWFYHRADGSFGNHVGDWTDIVDLDYSNPELWDYQIETLKYWASMVDGFRCDVAPLLPLGFWREARAQVEQVRPGCLWLAETVESTFISSIRRRGYDCLSDSQAFEAFDLCYDYDVYPAFRDYLEGNIPLSGYVQALCRQETIYPGNYVKLRYLENHDQLRSRFLIPEERAWQNWTAFLFFQKGTALVYGGQEAGCTHLPSLFDRDPVDWSGPDRTPLLQRLCALKKNPLLTDSFYELQALPGDVIRGTYWGRDRRLVGLFSLKGTPALLAADVPDGRYENLVGGEPVEVQGGRLSSQGQPVILEVKN